VKTLDYDQQEKACDAEDALTGYTADTEADDYDEQCEEHDDKRPNHPYALATSLDNCPRRILLARCQQLEIIVNRIHAILDVEGEDWDSGTIELVAEVLEDNGYVIRDPNEVEG